MFKSFNCQLSPPPLFADALRCRGVLLKKGAALLILVVSILIPCSQECFALEAEKPAELMHSSVVGGESRAENVERASIGMTQVGQYVGESSAENGGSRSASISLLSPQAQAVIEPLREPMAEYRGDKNNNQTASPLFMGLQVENPFHYSPPDTLLWWVIVAISFFSNFLCPIFIGTKQTAPLTKSSPDPKGSGAAQG